jgi:hypothetical protein
MLSILCFIWRLLQWTCTDSVLEGVLATDNTGLIARVTSQSKLRYSFPSPTFKSDWDIFESIVQTVRASHIHITLEHVRGHQDTTQAEELYLLAQLNVEADKYAGDFRFRQGEYCPIIPLMPTCSVSLNIDGKTVHRNFKTTTQEAIHGTALLEEMQVCYNWPAGTLELIDWEAHRQSTQAQSHHCTHFVKLCHELLPTGHLVCTYGTSLPDYCPLCKTPKEDFHHVLKCHHPSRVKWRKTLLSSLKERCYTLKTSPPLVECLISGLTSWFDDRKFPME